MQNHSSSGFSAVELTLRDYVNILFRHKWLFVSVLIAVLIGAAVWTSIAPSRYESTAAVVLRTNNNQQLFPSVGSSQRTQFVRQPEAEIEYVSSSFFANQAQALSPADTSVNARYNNDAGRSSQITFVASADNPSDSQAAASAWATFYLTLRATNDLDEVLATIEGTEALIADLEVEKDELLEPIKPIDDALLAETDSDTISRLTTQRLSLRQSLEDDLLPITLQLRTLSQDLSNLRIAAGYVSRADNSARLSIEPDVGRKVSPRSARNMALASVLGIMLGAGVVLLKESFRGLINGAGDLSALAPDVPILAQIPEFGRRTVQPLELAADPGTPYAQAFERVVSALLYERLVHDRQRMSVLVTSSVASEGKTTVASHLAYRLGSTPTATVLLDADLRRPDVHTTFGEPQVKRGLSHLLQDRLPLAAYLRPLRHAPRVRALFAGAATDDAAALLRQAFPAAIESLEGEYDLLVVDAPPVLAVTDAEVMIHSVDVAVVVVRAGRTTRAQLSETLRKLEAVDAHIAGFVLVGVNASGGYGYSYSYDYQSDPGVDQLAYSAEALSVPRKSPAAAAPPAVASAPAKARPTAAQSRPAAQPDPVAKVAGAPKAKRPARPDLERDEGQPSRARAKRAQVRRASQQAARAGTPTSSRTMATAVAETPVKAHEQPLVPSLWLGERELGATQRRELTEDEWADPVLVLGSTPDPGRRTREP